MILLEIGYAAPSIQHPASSVQRPVSSLKSQFIRGVKGKRELRVKRILDFFDGFFLTWLTKIVKS